jgi:hypothetical protein
MEDLRLLLSKEISGAQCARGSEAGRQTIPAADPLRGDLGQAHEVIDRDN